MNKEKIQKLLSELNITIRLITFLEDGYEILATAGWTVTVDEVSNIKIKGFSIISIEEYNGKFAILIVPTSMEEMTDYIWRYVENLGDKDEKLINILGDAVCALEKAIDSIPDKLVEEKQKALCNFNKFTSQIF